jgi:hypothetical protein
LPIGSLLSSCAFVQIDTQLKKQLLDKDAKLATILGIQSDALKNVPIPKRKPLLLYTLTVSQIKQDREKVTVNLHYFLQL